MSEDAVTIDAKRVAVRESVARENRMATRYFALAFVLGAPGMLTTAFWLSSIMSRYSDGPDHSLGAIGVPLLVAAVVCCWPAERYKAVAVGKWADFYRSLALVTVAGERVACIGSDFQGETLDVRFDDGDRQTVRVGLLIGRDGQPLASHRGYSEHDLFHLRAAKARWRTPDGRTGLVRGAIKGTDCDSSLRLKLEDGSVMTYGLSELEVVR